MFTMTDEPRPRRAKANRHEGAYRDMDDDEEVELAMYNAGVTGEPVNYQARLHGRAYTSECVRVLTGQDLDEDFLCRDGFDIPTLVQKPQNLGIIVPDSTFTVADVLSTIGDPTRSLEVIDVAKQDNALGHWDLERWVKYYETPIEERTDILNVISLEFSNTPLSKLVKAPRCARRIDWSHIAWPHSKTRPRVQKYCLMSAHGSYTDFHIDLGGTSVWYHVLRGRKIFYLIPPTERNLAIYAEWAKSASQEEIFLADRVETCYSATLHPGHTFFIPSGWIHAVWTEGDSLVFGGNFLHSYSIKMQLAVNDIEERTRVESKFRYPKFEEMQWYAADYLVRSATALPTFVQQGLPVLLDKLKQWWRSPRHRSHVPNDIDVANLLQMLIQRVTTPKAEVVPISADGALKVKISLIKPPVSECDMSAEDDQVGNEASDVEVSDSRDSDGEDEEVQLDEGDEDDDSDEYDESSASRKKARTATTTTTTTTTSTSTPTSTSTTTSKSKAPITAKQRILLKFKALSRSQQHSRRR